MSYSDEDIQWFANGGGEWDHDTVVDLAKMATVYRSRIAELEAENAVLLEALHAVRVALDFGDMEKWEVDPGCPGGFDVYTVPSDGNRRHVMWVANFSDVNEAMKKWNAAVELCRKKLQP